MDIYERLLEICREEASNCQLHDVAMFDAIVARAIQEGIVVNQAAMRLVREKCPHTIIVYEVDGELEYIEMYSGGTFHCFEYSEEDFPELISKHQVLDDYGTDNYGTEGIEENDLENLLFVMRDGIKYFDEGDIFDLHELKVSERQERLEAWRTVSIDLPDEFLDLCDKYDLEPLTVLKGFIADVCGISSFNSKPRTDDYNSNGSDERDMAEQYFQRAHWSPEVGEKHGIFIY